MITEPQKAEILTELEARRVELSAAYHAADHADFPSFGDYLHHHDHLRHQIILQHRLIAIVQAAPTFFFEPVWYDDEQKDDPMPPTRTPEDFSQMQDPELRRRMQGNAATAAAARSAAGHE